MPRGSGPTLIYKVTISFNEDREDHYQEFVVRMKESDARELQGSLTSAADNEKIRHGTVEEVQSAMYDLPEFAKYLSQGFNFTLPGYGPKDWRP